MAVASPPVSVDFVGRSRRIPPAIVKERVLMLRSRLGLVAVVALCAGAAGCSLPEVLPLAGGTTSGPSPYGVWYEQHWATNSVLLAAADQPEDGGFTSADPMVSEGEPTDDELQAAADEAAAKTAEAGRGYGDPNAPVEANANTDLGAVDFDESSPFQFPASKYSGTPERSTEIPSDDLVPLSPSKPEPQSAPSTGGPIRY